MRSRIWIVLAILWMIFGLLQTILGNALYGILDIGIGVLFLILQAVDDDV